VPRHASLASRFGAGIVDLGIALPVAVVLHVTFGTGDRLFDETTTANATSSEINEAYWLLFGTIVGVLLLYSAVAEMATGASLGKWIVRIRPLEADGARIGRGRALMRNVAKWASVYVFFLGLIWALVDRRNRMWHDLMVGAYLADLRSRTGPITRA
jgi:uncharacterized RDD family membrane protein YckC